MTYHLFSPGGNPTALVADLVSREDYGSVAEQIIRAHPEIEQVGFIIPSLSPDFLFTVCMTGGEFCVNAARSAALFAGMPTVRFRVSGFDATLEASVAGDHVELILPRAVCLGMRTVPEGTLVDFHGIRFVVGDAPLDASSLQALLAAYDDPAFPAVGYIVRRTIGSHLGITPWVRVRDTGTCMLESACGSGSLAVALLSSRPSASVIQPSGSVYEVRSDADVLRIRGAVRYLGTHTL